MKRNGQRYKNMLNGQEVTDRHAVIYCRVSSKEQVENLSLMTQEKGCREYCERNGITVVKVFVEEGESAKTQFRPEFQKMLKYCKDNGVLITDLVVFSVSRFARHAYDHHSVKAVLAKLGIKLQSVSEPIDESPTGKLMENILADFAQYDNDSRSERTSLGMIAAIELGQWVWQTPIGYRKPAEGGTVSLEPDPEKAPFIRMAFELFATGGYTAQQVLDKVRALGLTTKRGKPFTNQALSRLLHNPVYRGRVVSQKWELDIAGDFEPIVDDATFHRVQSVLDGKNVKPLHNQREHPDFPLRGFVRCGSCGTRLTGGYSTGRSSRYAYYHCWNKDCRAVSVRREVLEQVFVDELAVVQPKQSAINLFKEVVKDVWSTRQTDALKLQGQLRNRLRGLEERRDTLESALLYEKTITKEIYDRQSLKLSEMIREAEAELQSCLYNQVDLSELLEHATKILGAIKTTWLSKDIQLKQRLQAAIYPEGISYTKDGLRTAVTSSVFKVLGGISGGDSHMATPTGFEPVFQP